MNGDGRYDITALPRRHRCPECGFAYDESMFLLDGWRLPGLRSLVPLAVVSGQGRHPASLRSP